MIGKMKRLFSSNAFEYFYYIFLAFLLIITILGFSFYFYFASILKGKAIEDNNTVLVQVKNAQDAILAETGKAVSSIVLNPTIRDYMDYYKVNDSIMIMTVQNSVENTVMLYDSIDSIFVDYVNEGMILSSDQGTLPKENFYESDFVKGSGIESATSNKVIARTKKDFVTGDKIPVISFINNIPINITAGTPNAVVVFNLKSDYLQNSLTGIQLKRQANILVIDKNGNIISNINKRPEKESQSIIAYTQKNCTGSSGNAVMELNHQKMLISYVNSVNYSWRYIYIIPMDEVTHGIGVLGIVTSLLCFFMVLLSIFGSVLISRKLYSPIKNALALFKPGKYEFEEKKAKETVALQNNINSILKKNDNLESLLKDYESFQSNSFLLSLLSETSVDKSLADKLEYFKIELDQNDYFGALIVSIDNSTDLRSRYSQKQINMLYIYIRENIAEMLFPEHKGFVVVDQNNELIVVLNCSEDAEVYHRIAKRIHEDVCKNMKNTFTIGVSLPHKGLNTLYTCYTEAMTAVNYRMLGGYNSVNTYADIISHSGNVVPYPFSVERKIISCIKTNNDDGMQKALDEFIDYLQCNPSTSNEFVRHYFLQLLSACIKCFYEMDQNLNARIQPLSEIYASIMKQETLSDMASVLKQLYIEVMDYLSAQRKNKNLELVTLISDYIEKNIHVDLSLENIAENFCISVSHLRKIFKEEKGTAPKDFIASVRLGKACGLLENTSMKIGDIAENVGYFSIQAFTRAFKQETGKTPGEYRMTFVKKNFCSPAADESGEGKL